MKLWISRFLLITVTLLLAASALLGQSASSLSGTVTDKSGAVIPGAHVQVVNAAQGITRDTTTNAAGAYFVPGLTAGTYNVAVDAKGFQRTVLQGIVLQASEKSRADAVLTVGSVNEEVTVSGTSIGQVQTQSSELAGTVTSKEINNLELNGRNFAQLVTLVPGVSNQTGQDEGTVGVNGSVAYSINGGRTEYNNWELDGANIMDNGSNGTLNVYPSTDAIAQVRVLTSSYGAQYGRNASGTVQAETKSGTNQWHGDAYEFIRNDAFNARSFFDQTRPAYKKNDFGYTLGGPIKKDKTFVFWSEEWRKEKNPNTFNSTVPSDAERGGNFSDLCPAAGSAVDKTNFPDCPVNPGTGAYFSNNQVPIDPNGAALLALIPQSNTTVAGASYPFFYNASPSEPTNWREELARIDQNFNSNEQAYFRFVHDSWSTTVVPTLWTGSSFPNIGTQMVGPGVDLVLHLTSTLSPTMVNEFVGDYTTDHIFLTNIGAMSQPSTFTMKGIFNNGLGGKLPAISLGGNNAYGFFQDTSYEPWTNSNPTYEYRDQISQIIGNHNLIYGGSLIAAQKNEPSGLDTQGTLNFNTSSTVSTGNAFADLLMGQIASYSQTNQNAKYYNRWKVGGLFLQDDWHATSRLTLNLGMRLDLMGTYREIHQQAYNWEAAAYNPANAPVISDGSGQYAEGLLKPDIGSAFNGLVQCGKNTTPGCMNGHLLNWAPRLGFSWDPTGHGTTAIRGAYGIFYDHTNGNEGNSESLEGSAPLVQTPTVYNIAGYNNVSSGKTLLAPLGVTSIPTQAIWPYVQQFHLDLQHQFFGNTAVTMAYVGSKGTHLSNQRNLNQLHPVLASQNPYGAGQPITGADCSSLAFNGFTPTGTANGQPVSGTVAQNLAVACGNDPNPYRPFYGFGNITYLATEANSSYHALQISARRNIGGLDLSLAYTWSHSIDDSSDRYDNNFVDSYNLAGTRASSNFDQRQLLNMSWVYDLPVFRHNPVLGGWQWSGIMGIQTGTPFSITNGTTYGDNGGVANGVGTGSFADVVGNPDAVPSNAPASNGPLLFNPAAFATPQGLTFGNSGRNFLRNPGRTNFDMGVFKTFHVTERQTVEFRAEGFNVFNHTQWSGVNHSFGGSNFLYPSGAHLGRIFQFGLKYAF